MAMRYIVVLQNNKHATRHFNTTIASLRHAHIRLPNNSYPAVFLSKRFDHIKGIIT